MPESRSAFCSSVSLTAANTNRIYTMKKGRWSIPCWYVYYFLFYLHWRYLSLESNYQDNIHMSTRCLDFKVIPMIYSLWVYVKFGSVCLEKPPQYVLCRLVGILASFPIIKIELCCCSSRWFNILLTSIIRKVLVERYTSKFGLKEIDFVQE